MPAKRVTIIFTGGTIAMRNDPLLGGAVPYLVGKDIMKNTPALSNIAEVDTIDFCNKPGPHIQLEDILELRNTVRHLFRDKRTDGVVIAQGTDTIEEVAYGLELLLSEPNPTVITGAMRNTSLIGADGPANLWQAILTAAADASYGQGVLVVFNGEIHLAREVTKASAMQLNAFRSPLFGPVGIVGGTRVQFIRNRLLRETINVAEITARVELVKFTIGMSNLLLDAIRTSDTDGVVIEGGGVGHVSEQMAAAVQALVAAGKVVVLTSRCYESMTLHDDYAFVGSEKWLREIGVIPAPGLNGPKARLKLLFALSKTKDLKEVREIFSSPIAYGQER
jgi:L-asparaginase